MHITLAIFTVAVCLLSKRVLQFCFYLKSNSSVTARHIGHKNVEQPLKSQPMILFSVVM